MPLTLDNLKVVVLDVESVGLYGEAFAFAAIAYDENRKEVGRKCCHFSVKHTAGTLRDYRWVMDNVVIPNESQNIFKYEEQSLCSFFFEWYKQYAHKGYVIAADCAWPVEAKFLLSDMTDKYKRIATYPIIDISNIMLCAGMDPTGTYERLSDELPNHNPLCDVKQSARLLFNAIDILKESKSYPLKIKDTIKDMFSQAKSDLKPDRFTDGWLCAIDKLKTSHKELE